MSLCGDAELKHLMMCFNMPVFGGRGEKKKRKTKILDVIVPFNVQFFRNKSWDNNCGKTNRHQ